MESFTAYLKLLAFSPLLVMGIHAAVVRILRRGGIGLPPQMTAVLSILLGFPIVGVPSWFIFFSQVPTGGDRWGAGIYGFFVYSGLAYSYFHLFNLSETARRLRILYMLVNKRKMTLGDLNTCYGRENMVSTRLVRLLETGQLRRQGDCYFLQGRLLFHVARAITGWRKFLRIG